MPSSERRHLIDRAHRSPWTHLGEPTARRVWPAGRRRGRGPPPHRARIQDHRERGTSGPAWNGPRLRRRPCTASPKLAHHTPPGSLQTWSRSTVSTPHGPSAAVRRSLPATVRPPGKNRANRPDAVSTARCGNPRRTEIVGPGRARPDAKQIRWPSTGPQTPHRRPAGQGSCNNRTGRRFAPTDRVSTAVSWGRAGL